MLALGDALVQALSVARPLRQLRLPRTRACGPLPWVERFPLLRSLPVLLVLVAAPAAAASAHAPVLASEPGTLALAIGGLATLRLAAMRRRKRVVVFPLFEREPF